MITTAHYSLGILSPLWVFLVLLLSCCCCCEHSSVSWMGYDRVTKVVNNAWKYCRVQISEECMNVGHNQFCAEPFCELSYEEWEILKPQNECQPVRTALNRLCKLLFFETCSSMTNGAKMTQSDTVRSAMHFVIISVVAIFF